MILFEKKNKYGSFNDLMDVSIETGDKWLDKKLNANICYGKGGGGSAPQDVPKTLQPYVKQVLDRAKGLYGSYLPQQLYQGERIMGFTPAEQAAQAGVAGMVERGISGDPALTSAGTYYQPALGLLGAGAQQQQAASGLLGAIAPTLGASGAQFEGAAKTLGGVAPALQQYQQRVGGAEQTLARVHPELQAYRQKLGGAEAVLGATAPTLSQYEQQLQQAAQTYGGAQQQLGRAEEAARAGTGSVGIGELDTARYMSPYQQQVIDIEKRQAMQDAAQVAQAIGAKAAGMGAFGGSRQAILEGQAASDLGTRLADIQTRGSQAAYDRALQTAAQQQQLQYGEDVAALGRQSTLGQALAGLAGAQTGIGQQQAGLGISGYGGLAGAGRETAAQLAGLGGQYGNIGQQVGALAGQQAQLGGLYGDIGQQLGSLAGQQVGVGQAVGQLAGQYGAGAGAMGQQAGGLANLSQAFGNLGQQALGQGYREQGYLAGVGEQERGLQQQRADLAYQQFVEQRDYPDVQLQKFSSLIQGFPFQFSQAPQQPSGFQQAVGTAATLGGLGRGLGFFNKGGKIDGNRKGGLSNVVYRQVGSSVGNLEDISLAEAYKKYLELAKSRPKFDRAKEEERLKSEQGFKIAQLGANILAADPSRGGLAAIGQAAPSAIEGLMDVRREREGLDKKERESELKDLLTQATVLEKLREAELAGTADVTKLTGLTDTEFQNVETAISKLQNPQAKKVASLSPTERQSLRRQATEIATADYAGGAITQSPAIFEQHLRNVYKDLLLGAEADASVIPDEDNSDGSPSDRVVSGDNTQTGNRTAAEIREDIIRNRQAARAAGQ